MSYAEFCSLQCDSLGWKLTVPILAQIIKFRCVHLLPRGKLEAFNKAARNDKACI